jgi:hypothetical protein
MKINKGQPQCSCEDLGRALPPIIAWVFPKDDNDKRWRRYQLILLSLSLLLSACGIARLLGQSGLIYLEISVLALLFADQALRVLFAESVSRMTTRESDINRRPNKWNLPLNGSVQIAALLVIMATYLIEWSTPGANELHYWMQLPRVLLFLIYGDVLSIIRRVFISQWRQVLVSVQITLALTLVCGIVFFNSEHSVQPAPFPDLATALRHLVLKESWAGPGVKPIQPLTDIGRGVSTFMNIIGYVLIVIPFGLIVSGFTDEIKRYGRRRELGVVRHNILRSIKGVYRSEVKAILPRRYLSMAVLKSRFNIVETDALEVVQMTRGLRCRSKKAGRDETYATVLVVERFLENRAYGGYCSCGLSPITIVSPLSYGEKSIGHFSRSLSLLLSANFISNDTFAADAIDPDHRFRVDDYLTDTKKGGEINSTPQTRRALQQFRDDLKSSAMLSKLILIIRSGASWKPSIRVTTGGEDGQHGFEFEGSTVTRPAQVEAFCRNFESKMRQVNGSQTRNGGVFTVCGHEQLGKKKKLRKMHRFVKEQASRADVITLYINIDLLEWSTDTTYFALLSSLRDSIRETLFDISSPDPWDMPMKGK